MPRFFVESIISDRVIIVGDDARHIERSLHMEPGRELVVSDSRGTDYRCAIEKISRDGVELRVVSSAPCTSECPVPVRLYQAMPKGDKLEFIVQKAVELGASAITPVLTSRCISRPSDRSALKRLDRLRRIACEAAKQCGRGVIPAVNPLLELPDALAEMAESDLAIMLYEESDTPLRETLRPGPRSVALLVGSEGGFSKAEAATARDAGVVTAGLGSRILRCETAPVCALSVLMYHLGEF